jgi:ABC-type Co2+ transport system permease subunit
MHVAFALMISVPAIMVVRSRILKVLWSFYPPLVSFVVMVTANHFWIDAALGVLVAGVSAYLAREVLARARPEAWAWATA